MRTLKHLVFGLGLAIWAWLGIEGFAMATGQNIVPQSCDANQGSPCVSTPGTPNNETPVCLGPSAAGSYECGYVAGSGTTSTIHDQVLPNDVSCVWSIWADGGTCTSNNCWLPGGGIVLGNCCAVGGENISAWDAGAGLQPLVCVSPTAPGGIGIWPNERDEHPYTLGCWDGGTHPANLPGPYLYPPETPYVCAGVLDNHAVNNKINKYDYYQTFVDAGGNPLGGYQRLMKADELNLAFTGLDQYMPLGWVGPPWLDDNLGKTFYHPNYYCQLPFYRPDGGWALADVGRNHEDLMECGGNPSDILGSGYFPCCGQEHDAGHGQPDLCAHPINPVHHTQVNHCSCVVDGNPCDRPRYLDDTSWAGAPNSTTNGFLQTPAANVEGMGECCSPGLPFQQWNPNDAGYDGGLNPVILQGQGFCRPDALHGLTPSAGSEFAPGYCNCLPSQVSCSSSADCCGSGVGTSSCVADGGPATCCVNKTFLGCSQDSDCCGAWNDWEGPGVANHCVSNQCESCSTIYAPCSSASDCCDPGHVCGGWEFSDGGGICTPPQTLGGNCEGDSWCASPLVCTCQGYGCNGKCVMPTGRPCDAGPQCIGHYCDSNTCNTCQAPGGGCTLDSQCCSPYNCDMALDQCNCGGPSSPCTRDADCCSGASLICWMGFCTP